MPLAQSWDRVRIKALWSRSFFQQWANPWRHGCTSRKCTFGSDVMLRAIFRNFVVCGTPIALATLDVGAAAQVAARDAPRLSLPIACQLGETCFIQNYVDVDPGPGVRDYKCGSATYQAHKGTDFRLKSTAQSKKGVAVRAAADGTVKRARDGMADVLATTASANALKGRECGNGLVMDHGAGWQTQYCHMRQGSLAVKIGDKVARGQRLGDVGYSGKVEFAHLHFAVRHNGETIDPFSGRSQDGVCDDHWDQAEGLWDERTAKLLAYQSGQVIAVSFSDVVPVLAALEQDHGSAQPHPRSKLLILFARLLNLRGGDRIRLAIAGPAGFNVARLSKPLPRNKATYMAYVGKRRAAPSWPPGHYEGRVQLIRGKRIVCEMQAELALTK